MVLLKAGTDLLGPLHVIGPAAAETLLDGGQRPGVHRVAPLGGKLAHPAGDLFGAAGNMVKQPLQVAGDQDVHGRRRRLMEGAAGVVRAGADKIGQDVVLVGGADQPAHRQAHALGVVAGQDVAEVAGGNAEVHRLAPGHGAGLRQAEVGIEIIDDLRHQAAPVDGVGAGEPDAPRFQLRRHIRVGKDALDAGLGIVKVAVHREHRHVIPLLGGHLQALDLAGASIGVEHRDLDALQPRIAGQSRLAGIAGGRHQDAGGLGAVQVPFALHQQLGHQLQGVILKGAGGAVPQFQRVEAAADLFHMARLAAKGVAVGVGGGSLQKGRIIVRQKTAHHFGGQFGVRKAAPGIQIRLGEGRRHIQAAVRRKAAYNGFSRRNAGAAAACALILHRYHPSCLCAPAGTPVLIPIWYVQQENAFSMQCTRQPPAAGTTSTTSKRAGASA